MLAKRVKELIHKDGEVAGANSGKLLSWLDLRREDRTVFLGLGECAEGWPNRSSGFGYKSTVTAKTTAFLTGKKEKEILKLLSLPLL